MLAWNLPSCFCSSFSSCLRELRALTNLTAQAIKVRATALVSEPPTLVIEGIFAKVPPALTERPVKAAHRIANSQQVDLSQEEPDSVSSSQPQHI